MSCGDNPDNFQTCSESPHSVVTIVAIQKPESRILGTGQVERDGYNRKVELGYGKCNVQNVKVSRQ